jgi:hypothetical protein
MIYDYFSRKWTGGHTSHGGKTVLAIIDHYSRNIIYIYIYINIHFNIIIQKHKINLFYFILI